MLTPFEFWTQKTTDNQPIKAVICGESYFAKNPEDFLRNKKDMTNSYPTLMQYS